MSDLATITQFSDSWGDAPLQSRFRLALVIIWCGPFPERVGEVFLMPAEDGQTSIIGRARPGKRGGAVILRAVRQRPGGNENTSPLALPRISRRQLFLRADTKTQAIKLQNVGRCPIRINGQPASSAELRPGDVVLLKSSLALLCTWRPEQLPDLRHWPQDQVPPFGLADDYGFVGESMAAWAVRNRAGFMAGRKGHLLIHGSSGTGKELVAQAVHGLSSRSTHDFVARNVATIPDSLLDAELFGNVKDYPNPGMRERPGMIGDVNGSTLFLDEIGESSDTLQAALLRVLDCRGEYHRLGEARPRSSDFRLIASTNRSPHTLKHDLLARFKLRLEVPDLNARREDIPLIASHILRQITLEDPDVAEAFISDEYAEPRVDGRLMSALVQHHYTSHTRELETLLWRSISTSLGDRLELTQEVQDDLGVDCPPSEPMDEYTASMSMHSVSATADFDDLDLEQPFVNPRTLTPEQVQDALDRNDGIEERAWRDLRLRNRFQLIRLIKKHGLQVNRP